MFLGFDRSRDVEAVLTHGSDSWQDAASNGIPADEPRGGSGDVEARRAGRSRDYQKRRVRRIPPKLRRSQFSLQWKANREGSPGSCPGARGPHRPAVQLDQVADDCKPQAKAAVLPRRRAIALAEPLEDVREEIGYYSLAGVPHRELQPGALAPENDLHLAAPRNEADGVREQVPEHLFEAGWRRRR